MIGFHKKLKDLIIKSFLININFILNYCIHNIYHLMTCGPCIILANPP